MLYNRRMTTYQTAIKAAHAERPVRVVAKKSGQFTKKQLKALRVADRVARENAELLRRLA